MALAWCAGLVATLSLPGLLLAGAAALAVALLVVLVVSLASRPAPVLAAALLAMACGALWWLHCLDEYRLARDALLAGPAERQIRGLVENLPTCDAERCRFVLRSTVAGIQVHWHEPAELPRAGQHCTLAVRLRPVWGLANPTGFDPQAAALRQRIHASAAVIAGACARRTGGGLQAWRQSFSERLLTAVQAPQARALVPALVTGDRRAMTADHWDRLTQTGTAHLLAISGLHVSLVAGFGALLGRGLYRRWTPLAVPQIHVSAGLGLICALIFAALSGWSVATRRACAMLALPLAALLLRQPIAPFRTLTVALFLVLLLDPAAALSRGTWLSFGAVAVLLTLVWGRTGQPAGGPGRSLLHLQLALTAGMLPAYAALGLPVSPGYLVANLVAVPFVSLLVLPGVLLGALIELSTGWTLPLKLAALMLEALWWFLGQVAHWLPAVDVPWMATPAIFLGCALALLPRQTPGWPAVVLGVAVALLVPRLTRLTDPGLHVLDVGQGTAVVVTTARRTLLIDAGPGSADGWNAGRSVVAPRLAALGRKRIDLVLVSHADADHAGGLSELPDVAAVRGVSPDRRWPRCLAGMRWQLASLTVQAWHPGAHLPYLGNDSSCVLTLTQGRATALLPGDVSALVESRLRSDLPPVDLLLLGHHGSSTSSGYEFLRKTQPALAVATSRFGNRFGMPHGAVRRRLGLLDVPLLSTAECGALDFRWGSAGLELLAAQRLRNSKPWQLPALCPEPAPLSHVRPGLWGREEGENAY
ncbi:MAG: DNA internalization-related competence protein ComEC/Rec2 [Pseudomonadota bacterium]